MSASVFISGAVIVSVSLIVIYMLYRFSTPQKNRRAVENLDVKKRVHSWAAGQLKIEYYALPENHRPAVDIDVIIHALDTKYGIRNVNDHFMAKVLESADQWRYVYGWQHNKCNIEACVYRDYVELHQHMKALSQAHEMREHALLVAEQQYGFEQMEEFVTALRNEALALVDETHGIKEKGIRDEDRQAL